MKKIFCYVFAAILAVSFLSSCSGRIISEPLEQSKEFTEQGLTPNYIFAKGKTLMDPRIRSMEKRRAEAREVAIDNARENMLALIEGSYINESLMVSRLVESDAFLEKQIEINKYGPEEFSDYELITIPELRCIRRIWVFEKHEFDDSLPRIYQEVTGKEFDDPEWIGSETFGHKEWDLLGKICDEVMESTQYANSTEASRKADLSEDLFEIENVKDNLVLELVASLIDVENRATGMHDRKGILDSLEKCIKRDFYSDEEDATDYYRKQLQRKKDLGGKYNEKFFVNIKEEGGEFEDVPEGTEE